MSTNRASVAYDAKAAPQSFFEKERERLVEEISTVSPEPSLAPGTQTLSENVRGAWRGADEPLRALKSC